MKVKLNVMCTNPASFAIGDFDDCFNLFGNEPGIEGWFKVCEVEIEIDSSLKDKATKSALNAVDEEIEKVRSDYYCSLQKLENARNELLALEHIEE